MPSVLEDDEVEWEALAQGPDIMANSLSSPPASMNSEFYKSGSSRSHRSTSSVTGSKPSLGVRAAGAPSTSEAPSMSRRAQQRQQRRVAVPADEFWKSLKRSPTCLMKGAIRSFRRWRNNRIAPAQRPQPRRCAQWSFHGRNSRGVTHEP